MTAFWHACCDFLALALPYILHFVIPLALTLVLVPLVREMNRKLGMVDMPSARRINRTPIPRGGGLAVVIVCCLVYAGHMLVSGKSLSPTLSQATCWKIMVLTLALAAVGFADDRFGLKPRVKLLGQLVVACGAHFWCGIGFASLMPGLPAWADAAMTVFWIVGAINAFNLIDGLDGLATGLAIIAAVGMAGALCFIGSPGQAFVYLPFIGALIGFLRYNFNPASVFLGDTGSMFLGFYLATMPLLTRTGDSLLVGFGVPLLAMGVPIFDTALAIVRRTVRAMLSKSEDGRDEGNDKVMNADTDHLHHRLLRKFVSQRKTACAMYAMAAALVFTGLAAILSRDRAAALFILAFMLGAVVVVRDMSRVELWDTGRLLDVATHGRHHATGHRWHAVLVPFYVVADLAILFGVWAFATLLIPSDKSFAISFHTYMPLRVIPTFVALVFFRAYTTVWGRAQISNYVRLFLALIVGAAVTASAIVWLGLPHRGLVIYTLFFVSTAFLGISAVRLFRNVVRDLFYTLAARRISEDPNGRRTLVFGAGLRYRAFRRELVRRAVTGNRCIVGLIDENIVLRGHYIGGVRIVGSLADLPRIVFETRANEAVITADLPPEHLAEVVRAFKDAGLTVTQFTFGENPL